MLKQLKLRAEIKEKRNQLKELLEKRDSFSKKRDELSAALEEAQTDDDIKIVTDEITALEKEIGAEDIEGEISSLEESLEKLEGDLQETEARSEEAAKVVPQKRSESHGGGKMVKRTRFFGLSIEERDALIASAPVQEFVTRARELALQKRSVTGAELLIPEELLDLLKENISKYSKLINKVRLKPVKGTARQPIMGTIPEGIWMEMTGALNELEFIFNQAEVDGYKVGGFVAIPNSTLEDNISLLTEILDGVGQSVGYAIDKAIVYGIGIKQPLGIVTRLAQTTEPNNYSDKMPEWVDLHTTNIVKINETTAAGLWEKIVLYSGRAKSKYSIGMAAKFCVMNETTYTTLLSKLISFNVAGMQVAQMSNQMPIISGEIIVLDFMKDGDLLYGYGDLYLLAERAGTSISQSEHAMFFQDNTVIKGTARYDGLPVIAEGFVLMNIQNVNATTSVTFKPDYANTEVGTLAVKSVAGTNAGDTQVTVTGTEAAGTTLAYKVGGQGVNIANGQTVKGFTEFTSGSQLTVESGKIITIVELNAEGRAIKVGTAVTVAKTA